ncbi:pirin family protein [Microbulbifer sp. JTAC008]|uniref:pirin family protein n=1 Tax=unclassified Microbulbifer TaxID=2619833 RepID=UPI004039C38E
MSNGIRELKFSTSGEQGSDGAGVKLTRLIGTQNLEMLDPFLLLDSFESDNPNEYIGGFPNHPHRGFETVTYMINGKIRHKDNMGNEGVIEPNGVQWMTAGKGVIHSEMPEQKDGLLRGLQLWVNLPKDKKMIDPDYQEFEESQISSEATTKGQNIKVIAGTTNLGTEGVVENRYVYPTYIDVTLAQDHKFVQNLEETHNAFIYVIEGSLNTGSKKSKLVERQLGILTKGSQVLIEAGGKGSRFILVAGKPLNEPVVRGGPFVMNTKEELFQAFYDFNNNKF